MAKDKNTAPGDASTEGLPRRINKAERHADQARAAREEDRGGWQVGNLNTDNPGGYTYER
jgi:hypothetical protein